MDEVKGKACVDKLMAVTSEHGFPSFIFFCTAGGKGDGFALLAIKEPQHHARLMAQMTVSLIENDELYRMMKDIIKVVDREKGVS